MRKIFILFFISIFISCGDDVLPKPKGYLNLSYPNASYKKLALERPFSFDVSKYTVIKDEKNNWIKIQYPTLKASIDITYRPVKNNIRELLIEAEKLVFKHTVKAEQISSNNFLNKKTKVYGTVHKITGNAASQIQFHVTDSTKHFIKGALFFYTKPNYDSILPAVDYIKKDIAVIMESLEWKE